MPDAIDADSSTRAEVTVVIATIADERRAETIWRTIDSAGPRSGAATRVVVVVNGNRYSPELLDQLQRSPKVECIYQEKGSLPLALMTGRQAVRSEFFAFIDDDDEFLPGGLDKRIHIARTNPQAAFVITQGWLHHERDEPQVSLRANAVMVDPLGTLLQENWICTSASGLYRSEHVSAEDFAGMPSYLEWTYLGFRLASKLPFVFSDEPTYRRYDMPGSVSKSDSYRRGMVQALHAILALDLPEPTRFGLRRKLTQATHDLSQLELDNGLRGPAWRHHIRSICMPGGWRYLGYTRHLLGLGNGTRQP